MPEPRTPPGPPPPEPLLPPVLSAQPDGLPAYAELHCLSHFSFGRGASHPQELVQRAYALGYAALALTDECSVAGVVRAWTEWRELQAWLQRLEEDRPQEKRLRPFRLLYGSSFDMGDGTLVALAHDLPGWGGLCEFITAARRAAPKGHYQVGWELSDFALLAGCEVLWLPARDALDAINPIAAYARLVSLAGLFGSRLWLGVELLHLPGDDLWLATLRTLGAQAGVPLVACGGVQMHVRSRKPLHDVLTAIRLGRPVADCGLALAPNAERHLRPRERLARIHPPALLAATLEVAQRCRFVLDDIRYDYPQETVPAGHTPAQALRALVLRGMRERYPQGTPLSIRRFLVKELRLIALCRYEMFFLTVEDIVRFARSRGILCQGRGSAANSVVCYCLGITAADPVHSHPLLERFISVDRRNEPPDIDVDFEHERREEVIQYIYAKYGRERAALAATVICWRTRSAIRGVGMALGVPAPLVDAFAKEHHWFDDDLAADSLQDLAAQTGVALPAHQARWWLALTRELLGAPRHLSQHVGGFVLTQTRLTRLVPVENAAMPERSIIQWDKDDLEAMGLLKVDVLALGMLTAIHRCIDLVAQRRGRPFSVYDIPPDDTATFDMVCRADTVGVFQIESRAQMSMLPRLQPRCFYDLVVEVAIVRPGPIAGGMVHPYLKARERVARGLPIVYERSRYDGAEPRLKAALARTLGIPIFQEQVMQISMLAAGFSATEADGLRRAMAAWKRKGGVHHYEQRLIGGMLANGYTEAFARRIFEQVKGFGDYGFPESHAWSFALITWQSCWLKCHEPSCFLAAMLNSQPLGFYTPSQLVQDAQRHGIEVRPVDVSHSGWHSALEGARPGDPRAPVRLGLHLVAHLGEAAGRRIEAVRQQGGPFAGTEDLALRAQLDAGELKALASADALRSLSGHRRQQVWDAAALQRAPALLRGAPVHEDTLQLPAAPEGEEIVFDYAATGLTLRRHPLALLRPRLARMQLLSAQQLQALPDGRQAAACGIVTVRQQPQTAKGTMFVTLEDETGPVNVIVWKSVREAQRPALLRARLLAVRGIWQCSPGHSGAGQVRHLVAQQCEDLTPLLGRLGQLGSTSRDFH